MKIFKIFIDDQADEQVAGGCLLFLRRQGVEGFGENLVRRPIADLVNDVLFDAGQRPRITNWRATLRSHPHDFRLSSDRYRYPTFLKSFAVKINLSELLSEIAAGQPSENGQRRIRFIPTAQPSFAVDVERIEKGQPAIGLARFDPRFHAPVAWAIGFLDLLLTKMKSFHLGPGQIIKRERKARLLLKL